MSLQKNSVDHSYDEIFNKQVSPEKGCTLVIFGASGDLAKRKLYPSLYQLFKEKRLPHPFQVVGYSRTKMSKPQFIKRLKSVFNYEDESFFSHLTYLSGKSYSDVKSLSELKKSFNAYSKNRVYYLSLPPTEFRNVCSGLKKANLITANSGSEKNLKTVLGTQPFTRIMFEKPFGVDYKSAEKLNRFISNHFKEDQLASIDHYVGKEPVQNLMYFRFANSIFENLWNNRYIDHIQISLNEDIRVEKRGGYFDTSGLLRDMIQSHALQILALVCMEIPNSISGESIRREKAKVLQVLQKFEPETIEKNCVRAQYNGYRQEEGVNLNSTTETFVAMKLSIDNWRWKNTPIYIRTGKAMRKKRSELVVSFKEVPHNMFKNSKKHLANKLVFRFQPKPFFELLTYTKTPGSEVSVSDTGMHFSYEREYKNIDFTNGYDKILNDALINDGTLFLSVDELLAQWQFCDTILEEWKNNNDIPLYTYKEKSDGPKEAHNLIERDNRKWNSD